jgi:hypothetical protein
MAATRQTTNRAVEASRLITARLRFDGRRDASASGLLQVRNLGECSVLGERVAHSRRTRRIRRRLIEGLVKRDPLV